MTDLIETEEAQRINRIWEGLRDEPGHSPDGLTNPLYRRQPNPPERRRDMLKLDEMKLLMEHGTFCMAD